MSTTIAGNARRGAQAPRGRQWSDLWPTAVGPNVLAWSYADDHPDCHTIYTVFVGHPGGVPHLQLSHADGGFTAVPIDNPERFGRWDTPRAFAEWARAWKNAGD